tara:strand:+ start:61 stop:195 length:135 start_codon:yes stop_codon:yes gene_type:complete
MHKNKNTKKKTKMMYGGTAKKKMQMGGAMKKTKKMSRGGPVRRK